MLRFDDNHYRFTVFWIESILHHTFDGFSRIPLTPEFARQAITQVNFFNLAKQLRPNTAEANKIT